MPHQLMVTEVLCKEMIDRKFRQTVQFEEVDDIRLEDL
jgi:hypothetical protein